MMAEQNGEIYKVIQPKLLGRRAIRYILCTVTAARVSPKSRFTALYCPHIYIMLLSHGRAVLAVTVFDHRCVHTCFAHVFARIRRFGTALVDWTSSLKPDSRR